MDTWKMTEMMMIVGSTLLILTTTIWVLIFVVLGIIPITTNDIVDMWLKWSQDDQTCSLRLVKRQ